MLHLLFLREGEIIKNKNYFKICQSKLFCLNYISPFFREVDWLFSTKEGRKQLLESAQFNRLAIVVLNRKQQFENLDFIKNELADSVKNLAPSGLGKAQIPFLSLGSDIGKRKVCFEGESKFSGKFVIEEVENEDGLFRRLIFLNNQFVVQSEAKLKKGLYKKNSSKLLAMTSDQT